MAGGFEDLERARHEAGTVDGRHYSAHVGEVKRLVRSGDDDAAAGLLLRLIDAIEREAGHPLPGRDEVPPWYFDQLQAIYMRAGLTREAALLRQRHTVLQIRAQTAASLATRAAPADQRPPLPGTEGAHSLGYALGSLLRVIKRRR